MKTRALPSLFCIFCVVAFAEAAGRLESFSVGEFDGFRSARSDAMGRAGIVPGDAPTAIYNNPAGLDVDGPEFSFSPEVFSQYEKTSHNDAEKNIHEIFFWDGGFKNYSLAGRLAGFNLGFASGRVSDMNYRYEERDFKGVAVNEFSASGGLGSVAGAVQKKIKSISVGFSYLAVSGTKDVASKKNYTELPSEKRAFDGVQLISGILWDAGAAFRAGFTYKPAFDLKAVSVGTREENLIKMPETISAGFSLKISGQTDPVVNFEFEHALWQKYYPDLINTTKFRAGAEHTLDENIRFRYGIFYAQSYANFYPAHYFTKSENTVFGFTAGGGIVFDKTSLDFAVVFSQRSDQNIPRLFPAAYDPKYPRGNLDVSDLYNVDFKLSLGMRI